MRRSASKIGVISATLPGLRWLGRLLPTFVIPGRRDGRHPDQDLIYTGQSPRGQAEELTWDCQMKEHILHHKTSSTCPPKPLGVTPL
jgi:hypothetical protein